MLNILFKLRGSNQTKYIINLLIMTLNLLILNQNKTEYNLQPMNSGIVIICIIIYALKKKHDSTLAKCTE